MALAASLFLVIASNVKYGSSWASPRKANGTCFSFFSQLSGSLRLTPGKVPSDKPGTATTSHSAPFAMWTVRIWTTSVRTSGAPTLRPPSSSDAISSQSRNAETDPPLRSNLAASSRNRSKCLRPLCEPSRKVTSDSKVK